MKLQVFLTRGLRIGGLRVAAITLLAAVCVWTWYETTSWLRAPAQKARLAAAEDAARSDLATIEALDKKIEQLTAASLTRARRQRIAGMVALSAAAIVITLIKIGDNQSPTVPGYISDTVAERRAKATTPAGASQDNSSISSNYVAEFPPVDLTPLAKIVESVGREPRHLIPILHAVDEHYLYLPPAALAKLPDLADVTPTQVSGVVSFYIQFRTRPRGDKLVHVCVGTACHVAGADRILGQLRQELGIPPGEDTDPAGKATLETVGCLGCCTRAPVVQIDDQTSGRVSVEDVADLLSTAHQRNGTCGSSCGRDSHAREKLVDQDSLHPGPLEIRIGLGSCCVAEGSRDVMEALQLELKRNHLTAEVKPVGCVGVCHLTPMVEVHTSGQEPIVATRVTPGDVRHIVQSLPIGRSWPTYIADYVSHIWRSEPEPCGTPISGIRDRYQITSLAHERIESFTSRQVRIVTEHCGEMDPKSYEEYRSRDGFVALEEVLAEGSPETVIDLIEASGLRGRGGAGFPTSRKWRMVAAADGDKILVCNGDEGDPGAFMDRMILESYPFRVLEGMAIAAFAVGARRAIMYIRHEYPLAVRRMKHAVSEMTRAGWLGDQISDDGESLTVEIVEGAGAFVCGEETALLESIMGRRGTPHHRPPYPAEQGLWDLPTLVNNVETFANVPWIVRKGAKAFASLGTDQSHGTKVFSLAGKVRKGGLIEVPMGVTIREVVEEIGGGVAPDRTFKAVQIGGPSGGCIPASLADTPIDYQALRSVGAIMGSGGLVVMDDTDCMVDVARYFVEFTERESCGHCTFCRLGTQRLLDILSRLCEGKGKLHDLEELESLSQQVIAGSLCGLGKTAPNPILTTLKYFRHEYEAHLAGHCPAGRCKSLIRYAVTRDCVGCTLCAQHCPVGAIPATPYQQHVIDSELCTRCDVCRTTCPENAIEVKS